jgi:hypothetical protein
MFCSVVAVILCIDLYFFFKIKKDHKDLEKNYNVLKAKIKEQKVKSTNKKETDFTHSDHFKGIEGIIEKLEELKLKQSSELVCSPLLELYSPLMDEIIEVIIERRAKEGIDDIYKLSRALQGFVLNSFNMLKKNNAEFNPDLLDAFKDIASDVKKDNESILDIVENMEMKQKKEQLEEESKIQ